MDPDPVNLQPGSKTLKMGISVYTERYYNGSGSGEAPPRSTTLRIVITSVYIEKYYNGPLIG